MQITLNIENRDCSIALIRALSREVQGLHDAAIRGLAEGGAEDVQAVKAYYKYLYEQSKSLKQIASDAVQQLTKSCDYDDVRMCGLYSGSIDWKLEFRQGVEK